MKDLVQIAQKSKPAEPEKPIHHISKKRLFDKLPIQIIRYEYRFRKSLAKHITYVSLAIEYKCDEITIRHIVNKKYYREIPDMTAEQYHQSQKPKKKPLTVAEEVQRDKKVKGNELLAALKAGIDL